MKEKQIIEMIAIGHITVLNPRERSVKSFDALKENIKHVGLKKPITVRPSDDVEGHYDLVCGEGRLKSFIENKMDTIPAIVRLNLSKEDAYVMSLVENMARRQHSAMDLIKGIALLSDQGYGVMDISRKTGLVDSYVSGILTLIRKGEERLITSVEKGDTPLTIAIKIASSPHSEQQALQEAYEKEELRGNKFLTVQRLLEKRTNLGKGMRSNKPRGGKENDTLSSRQIVQKFNTELERMRSIVEKSNRTETALMIIVESFYNLLQDDNFKTLLRAENLNTIPVQLNKMIENRDTSYVR